MTDEKKASDVKAARLNLSGYKRHILLCGGPKCCREEEGDRVWTYLKDRLSELGLSTKETASVFRTRTTCLRVCCDGPIALVYPEGTWYRHVDQEALEKIIQSHLLEGKPVEELAFARNEHFSPKNDET